MLNLHIKSIEAGQNSGQWKNEMLNASCNRNGTYLLDDNMYRGQTMNHGSCKYRNVVTLL